MPQRPTPADAIITRRAVLLGAVGTAGLGLLAACSSSSDTTTTGGTAAAGSSGSAPPTAAGGAVLIAVFDPNSLAVAGVENRLAFSIGDSDGVPAKDGPAELTFTVTTGGNPVGDPITVPRHAEGTPIGYYPLRFTPATAGVYTASAEVDGKKVEQAFRVNETSPTDLVLPGQQLRDVATPTVDDPLGVDPICTQKPEPCPLHDTSLTTAIAAGGPIALLFSTPAFRVYSSDDILSVELGGALKNVIAIAAGIVEGLRYGHNTTAALITRGLAEITRLGVARGGNPLTFAGLSGMGDLVLTCTGALSRNRTVGEQLGRGKRLEQILAEMEMVAEGVKTTLAAHTLADRLGVEMPITEQVYQVLYEDKDPAKVARELMTRELKDEREA